MRIISCTVAIDQAEAALSSALIAMAGGTRPAVSPSQVERLLIQHYAIRVGEVQVKRYSCADFLLIFTSRMLVDQVLHTLPPPAAEF
jgi:hypothetical protein